MSDVVARSPRYEDLCRAKDTLGQCYSTFNALLRHAMAGLSYNEWVAEYNWASDDLDPLDAESDDEDVQWRHRQTAERFRVADDMLSVLFALDNLLKYTSDPESTTDLCIAVNNGLVDHFNHLRRVCRSAGVDINITTFITASLPDVAPLLRDKDERP